VRQVGWMRWDASGGSGDVQSHTLHVMHAGQVVQIERPLYPMQMVYMCTQRCLTSRNPLPAIVHPLQTSAAVSSPDLISDLCAWPIRTWPRFARLYPCDI
jgi:hypothetical protein